MKYVIKLPKHEEALTSSNNNQNQHNIYGN